MVMEQMTEKWRGTGPFSYEDQSMVNRYLLSHYGQKDEIFDPSLSSDIRWPVVKQLPVYVAEIVHRFSPQASSVLDLGCSVGRTSFELARNCCEVHGIDASSAFIEMAHTLKIDGKVDFKIREIGDDQIPATAMVDSDIDRKRVTFEVGDACDLPMSLHSFDAVVLANVICRLPNPAECLKRMGGEEGLVKRDGFLVITAPMSWMEAFTPKDHWLTSLDAIGSLLPGFILVHSEDAPFMIREHKRKFEYIIAQLSVWQRTGG